jgi:hypothetical protein
MAYFYLTFFAFDREEPNTPEEYTYEEALFFRYATNLGCRRFKIATLKFLSLGKIGNFNWQIKDNSSDYIQCLEIINKIEYPLLVLLIRQFYIDYCLPTLDGECAKNKVVSPDGLDKTPSILDEIEQFLLLIPLKSRPSSNYSKLGLTQAIRDWKIAQSALINEQYTEAEKYLNKIYSFYRKDLHTNHSDNIDRINFFITFINNELEYNKTMNLFKIYINIFPKITIQPDKKLSYSKNIETLFKTDPILKNNPHKQAEVLAASRGYEPISSILNKYSSRIASPSPKSGNIIDLGFLGLDTAILAIVNLAETGDSSAEFEDLITLLQSVVSKKISQEDNDVLRYAALATLYRLDPKLINKIYRDDERLNDSKIEGKMDYVIVHAPQIVKEIFFSDSPAVHRELDKIYTPTEASKFFKNFKPSDPLPGGFLLVVDEGNAPGGKTGFIGGIKTWPVKLGSFAIVSDPNKAKYIIHITNKFKLQGRFQVISNNIFSDILNVYLQSLYIKITDLTLNKVVLNDKIEPISSYRYEIKNYDINKPYVVAPDINLARHLDNKLSFQKELKP